MNVHPQPLGVFDSGIGGLSVVSEIRRRLPGLEIIYLADSLYCPYGDRKPAEIRERSSVISRHLVGMGASIVVVACNTATAAALETLREELPVPVIGLEPAIKPAVAASRTGKIGVLATTRTATSERLRRLIDSYAADLEVHVTSAPKLVELVESGLTAGHDVDAAIAGYIQPMLDREVDTIVLGCTHFQFLRGSIQALAGRDIAIIDSGEAIARRAASLLGEPELDDILDQRAPLQLLTTGDDTMWRNSPRAS